MNITVHLYFYIKMIEPIDHKYVEAVKDIECLKNEVFYLSRAELLSKVSCKFTVTRELSMFAGNQALKSANDRPIITDSFDFIVADKLTYIKDLKEYLNKNFEKSSSDTPQDVIFKNFSQFKRNQPIFFTGPYEYNGSFLPDAPLKERPLTCRPLTDKDVVVNTKLQQIWPKATGKTPPALIELLNKTTEKIY